jgi:hypothetical protein
MVTGEPMTSSTATIRLVFTALQHTMAKKWIDDNSELMQAALVARKDVTVIWHLIHVLEKLEKGVP